MYFLRNLQILRWINLRILKIRVFIQSIVFVWIQTYREIFKSASVCLIDFGTLILRNLFLAEPVFKIGSPYLFSKFPAFCHRKMWKFEAWALSWNWKKIRKSWATHRGCTFTIEKLVAFFIHVFITLSHSGYWGKNIRYTLKNLQKTSVFVLMIYDRLSIW